MDAVEDLDLAAAASSDIALAELITQITKVHPADPEEPPFLPAYNPEYHEPSLGQLPLVLQRLYVFYIDTCEKLSRDTTSAVMLRYRAQVRFLFRDAVRKYYMLAPEYYHREFEVCKDWRLCLVTLVQEEIDLSTVSAVPSQPFVIPVTRMSR